MFVVFSLSKVTNSNDEVLTLKIRFGKGEKQLIHCFTIVLSLVTEKVMTHDLHREIKRDHLLPPLQQNKTVLFKHSLRLQAARSEGALCCLRKMEKTKWKP